MKKEKSMDVDIRRLMVKHGGIVAFIGALSGLVYTFVISGDIPGSIRAWHLAHLQGIMTGMLIIAASSFVSHAALDEKKRRIMAISFIITGYCYAVGPIWGAVFAVRGLMPEGPFANIVMLASNTVASISVLIGLGLLIAGSRKAS